MNCLRRIPLRGLSVSQQLRVPSIQRHILAPRFITTSPQCLRQTKDHSRREDDAKSLDPGNLTEEEASVKAESGKQAALQDLGHSNIAYPHKMHEAASTPTHIDNLQLPKSKDSDEPMQGRLISTPSRLLKLLVPLRPPHEDPPSSVPLTLLIHPSQPLSYVERLLQAELPVLPTNPPRPPDITFLAHNPDATDTSVTPKSRFSAATEVGDFLRAASKHHLFFLQIEGSKTPPLEIRVPSFKDRTFYLRARLRAVSVKLEQMTAVKNECDTLAQRGAQRVAVSGCAGLVGWWASVWYATFHTTLGWDVMEPVTYLVGLSGVISGYLWFLWHNREVSYRSVLHLTVSRRQIWWYDVKGFNMDKWKEAVEEVREIRREIRKVAMEYDEEWEEETDEMLGGRVKQVLKKEEEKEKRERRRVEELEEKDD